MPEFIMPLGCQQTWQCLDAFTQGYWEAAFFTECNSDNPELRDATFADVAKAAYQRAIDDCRAFQESLPKDGHGRTYLDLAYDYAPAKYDATMAGRDFWYTRNGHGVGFWDRGLGAIGDKLSELCGHGTAFRPVDLIRGDDELLYLE